MDEEPGEDGLFGYTAVADDANAVNGFGGLRHGRDGRKGEDRHQKQPSDAAVQPQVAANEAGYKSVLDLHRAAALRRAQKILVRSMVQLRGKNMHTLIAQNRILRRGKTDYI
jgi:hypothetical protein